MRVLADSDVTRLYFIDAGLPSQLYPFLDLDKSASKNPKQKDQTMAPRKHVLMLIFSLVKAEDEKVNKYLFDTEYMSKGMQIIQFGELTEKLIATFILFKILSTPKGLNHCCQSYDRFCHMDNVFKSVIDYVRDRMQAYVKS